MTTYKVTKLATDKSEKYFEDLIQAMSKKQILKKLRKDADLYHIYGMPQGSDKWFRLE